MRTAAVVFVSLVAPALMAACGTTVPFGGIEVGRPADPLAEVEPLDLVPADLDLVVRFDLAALRAGLGAEPLAVVTDRAMGRQGDALLERALSQADVAWLALRPRDAAAGDRVLVLDAPARDLAPEDERFREVESPSPDVDLFQAAGAIERDGVALVALVGDRASLFASPVEASSVRRVLREGPDPGRGEPEATGLVSVDWRAAHAAAGLEGRFPSLAKVLGGIERVRAQIDLAGQTLELGAGVRCKSTHAADRLLRFLVAIRDGTREGSRYAEILQKLDLSVEGTSLQARWSLPADTVLGLIRHPADLDDTEAPAP